jgi:hypothetical protein
VEWRGEEGETVDGSGVEIGAAAPWRVRPGRRWMAAEALLYFGRGPKGRIGRLGDWAEIWREILFGIKIGFVNLPRLWKFVQGHLGGILMWGFFLNSSRLFKDFRKTIICHAM